MNYFLKKSEQSIKHCPYFSKKRISSLVIENLKSKGFIICKDELNKNQKNTTLASAICGKYKIEYSEAICAVDSTISEAFNSKYGTYKYSDDARSLDSDWKKNFCLCMRNYVQNQCQCLI